MSDLMERALATLWQAALAAGIVDAAADPSWDALWVAAIAGAIGFAAAAAKAWIKARLTTTGG